MQIGVQYYILDGSGRVTLYYATVESDCLIALREILISIFLSNILRPTSYEQGKTIYPFRKKDLKYVILSKFQIFHKCHSESKILLVIWLFADWAKF